MNTHYIYTYIHEQTKFCVSKISPAKLYDIVYAIDLIILTFD